MAQKISIKGLRVFAHHGVFDFERQNGQDFYIDATVWVGSPKATLTDNLGDTVHYGDLAKVIVENVKNGKGNLGYDALKNEMVPDMIAAGIVDPVKVTRLGVENACSAAAILLTTEAAIADIPEPKNPPSGGGGMGMDGMY